MGRSGYVVNNVLSLPQPMNRITYGSNYGFALPSLLIASFVMMTVLVSAASSASTVSKELDNQHYQMYAKEAAHSGRAYAKKCIDAGGITWTDAMPLRPYTDCAGSPLPGLSCPVTSVDSRCYVHSENGLSSSFSVGGNSGSAGVLNITSVGTLSLKRQSSGQVWKDFTSTVRLKTGAAPIAGTMDQLSAGLTHTCYTNGTTYCWGLNAAGQLGDGSTNTALSPTAVSTSGVLSGKTVASAPAGQSHTCAVTTSGSAYCWGEGSLGQLGNASTSDSSIPVAVSVSGVLSGKTVLTVAGFTLHTCAIASDNKVYCWGGNSDGQLGNATTSSSSSPVTVSTAGVLSGKVMTRISSGDAFTCALASDGRVYCWGNNADGQLGDATMSDSSSPVAVSVSGVLSGKTITAITTGQDHTCALDSAGLVYCWGEGLEGQLGRGSTTDSSTPVAVSTSGVLSGKTVTSINAGEDHTCAITTEGRVYCWGSGVYGQLGNGSTGGISTSPVAVSTAGVMNGKTATAVTGGEHHTCALTDDVAIYCWGEGISGQLGNGSTANSSVPVATVMPVVVPVAPGASQAFTMMY